jgi:cytochrome P450
LTAYTVYLTESLVPRPHLPPGPTESRLLQLFHASSDPYAYLEKCQRQYGDVFTLRWPGQAPLVFVAEPAAVRTLVTGGYGELARNGDALRFMLGDRSLIFQQGEEHKETRKLLAPPFHGDRMRAYGAAMARAADEVLASWGDGEERTINRDFQEIALRVIVRCIFGDSDAERLADLGRHFVEYVDRMFTPSFYASSLVLGGRRMRKLLLRLGEPVRRGNRAPSDLPLLRVADRLGAIDRILFEEIARYRALSDAELAERPELLAMLMAIRYADGSQLTDEALRDQLMTLLLGGHETTATALAWAIDCALRNPGTLERMRAEVTHVMDGGFDPTKIKQLGYIGAVISESMRLRPIATAIPRQLAVETTVCGYALPAGTLVQPCLYLVQRDPRVWPDESAAFRPERFLDKKPSVYEYFPFGAGVWRCIGAQFAEYEMRVVLARLVAQLDLEAVAGIETRPMQRGFTISPSNGVPVRVRLRRAVRPAQPAHEARA